MYLLALMSKPTSLPVPVLMLVLDYWPLNRFNRRAVIEKIPFFAIGLVFTVITAVSNTRSLGIPLSSRIDSPAHLLHTFLTACYLIIFYLRKIFWPANLSSVYLLPEPMSLSNWIILASVFGTLILIAGLFFSLRRTRAFLAGLLFFFLAILPVLGIVPFSDWIVASDKYVYMPIIGLLAVLAWAITSLWKRIAVPRTALIILLLFLSSVQIYCLRRYLAHWQDAVGLFEYMLKLTPDNARVHYNLGVALQLVGRDEDTISHFQQALKLKPDYAEAHNNLGLMLAKQGSLDEALNHLQQALKLNYNYPDAHNSLGFAFQSLGRMDEAINEYREAVRIKPDYSQAYNNLGALLQEQGRFDEAISYYRSAIQFKPAFVEAH
jgi:Tfp pilus assembly protein PilF